MDSFTPLVATHALAAGLAMTLGVVNLLRRKRGDLPHRALGWIWATLMYFVAVSSFWIRDLRPGQFSWIHVLSAFTLVSLTCALLAARRGLAPTHAGFMIGSYVGLLGAFIGAVVVPSRRIPTAFQHDWTSMTMLTATVVTAGTAVTVLIVRLARRRTEPGRRRAT